jgi:hypothetical protein
MWVGENIIVGWSNHGGDALSVHCCIFVLKEQGSGGDGAGEGHMLYTKCARCQWEPGKSGNSCMILGVSAQKNGKKDINNDAPECHQYCQLIEPHSMKAHQVGLYIGQQLDASRLAHGLKRGLVVIRQVTG